MIEDFDVQLSEFWMVLNYLNEVGCEFGLIVVGFGFECFFDVWMDEVEVKVGIQGGMLCMIEGLLYVVGVLELVGYVCFDDGIDLGQMLIMCGCVFGQDGVLFVNVLVEVWYVNYLGNYLYFDVLQLVFNLCCLICIDVEGCYSFCSVLLVGYSVLLGSKIE